MDLSFRIATQADCGALSALINSAYRGETSQKGWTTESHLLDGQRTDEEDLKTTLASDKSNILMTFDEKHVLIGSVFLERRAEAICYLGMFTVNPLLQSQGVGRALLNHAEKFARDVYQSEKMQMTVITARPELLAWYERRGYTRTGRTIPFPVHEKFGVLKVDFWRWKSWRNLLSGHKTANDFPSVWKSKNPQKHTHVSSVGARQ